MKWGSRPKQVLAYSLGLLLLVLTSLARFWTGYRFGAGDFGSAAVLAWGFLTAIPASRADDESAFRASLAVGGVVFACQAVLGTFFMFVFGRPGNPLGWALVSVVDGVGATTMTYVTSRALAWANPPRPEDDDRESD